MNEIAETENKRCSLSAEESMRRTIRTFAIRAGHFTACEKKDYAQLLPVFGVQYKEEILDFEKIFGNKNPVVIEIGFGMGKATAIIAENNPDINYLGLEVHKPGVGKLLGEIPGIGPKIEEALGSARDTVRNFLTETSGSDENIDIPVKATVDVDDSNVASGLTETATAMGTEAGDQGSSAFNTSFVTGVSSLPSELQTAMQGHRAIC